MSGLTSVDGIISGLKTTEIIDSIMAVERRPVTLLEAKNERYNTEFLSYQSMTAKLLSIQSDADALARASTFEARTTSSSDTDILTASAAPRAVSGTYDLTVAAIARSHQVASQGFADTDTTTVGTGTLVFTVAARTTTVTVDTSNNTLEGLRDAINAAGSDVKASIINDGATARPYRLLLTSSSTGLVNAISITNNLSGGATPNFATNSVTDPVAASGNYYTGTATAGGTYTGTSGKTYTVEIVDAGALGAATYRVSEDGGTTWGATQATATTISVYDDQHATDLGARMYLTAGDFNTGDRFTVRAFVPTVQQAADAKVQIGSGAGAIEVTSSTNRITDAIPGVTLSLVSANLSKTVSLEVAQDKTGIKDRIKSLVANFNAAADYITSQSGYNVSTKAAGVLLGNMTMIKLQSDLRMALLASVPGASTYDSLFSLGLTISDNGSLSLDESKVTAALNANFDDVAKIFKTTGTSSNSKIALISATSASKESTAGYDVDITQAATQGKVTGTVITDPASAPLVIDSTNNQLIVSVDGRTSQILQLTQKSYTSGDALAREIQNQINADTYLAGKSVAVTFVDQGATGYLEIKSALYGAASSVAMGSPANDAATVLGLAGAAATAGTDVAGTINGEAATGAGQFLTANTANANTAGIKLRVTLEPADIVAGAEGTLKLVKGVATRLSELLHTMTDSIGGVLSAKQKNLQTQIDDTTKRITEMDKVLAVRRKRLSDKFAAMEQSLALMQQQSMFIGMQYAALTSGQNQ